MKNLHSKGKNIFVSTSVIILLIFSTACIEDARAIWESVIKKCANNDLLGPDVFYFGPSNNLGPGTIFEKYPSGGIGLSYRIDSYVQSESARQSLINEGTIFSCEGTSSKKFALGLLLSLESLLSLSGDLKFDLRRAEFISVSVDAAQWIDIVTGPYCTLIQKLPNDHPVRNALSARGNLVLSRALRIRHMTAELIFSHSIGNALKKKFPEFVFSPKTDEVGIKLTGQWNSDSRLIISAASDFYIAGELRAFKNTRSDGDFGLKMETDLKEKTKTAEKPESGEQAEKIGPIEKNVYVVPFIRPSKKKD
jgi:hypothetical protein